MGDFFVSKNDKALAENIVSKSADLYIMPEFDTGNGVLDLTVPAAATLTDALKAWGVNALAGLIFILGGFEFVVASNTATAITFDSTSDVDGDDKSALLTDGASYDFRVWDTEEFLGYADETSLTDEEEMKEFKTEIPRKKIREDLLEKMISLATIIRVPSPGILKAAYNLKDESNATYYKLEAGSNPNARPVYYLIAKNLNVIGKNQQLRMYYCQIKPNGERVLGGGEDYEQVPVLVAVNSDPLRSDLKDRYRIRIEK